MIDIKPLLIQIASQYILDPNGAHGLSHWGRVLENGLSLADIEGGDITVIHLFAIFHDACRHNQTVDPGHGARGAALVEELLGDLRLVNRKQLDLLTQACREHTDGKTQADLTVQICWDSDRLDLARVHIEPDPRCLCTDAAKTDRLREWANQRAIAKYIPPYVNIQWKPLFIR